MNPSRPSVVGGARNDGLIVRYEELRRHALGRSATQGQGLALFVRRGMSAWMQAWSQCLPSAPVPTHSHDDQEICPVQLHKEMAMLLASMVLFTRQEALA
jgi:hypothetical protein